MKDKKKSKEKMQKIPQNNRTVLLISIILLIAIVLALYKVAIFVQNPTDTFRVEQGQIYQEEREIGYIIREETIVKGSNYENGMEEIKAEGEKVAKNEPIFRYYSNGEEKIVKKIQELDAKIEQAMAKENEPLTSSDIKALEKQIEDKITLLYQNNDMQFIKETKKEITTNITKKAKIAGELSPAGSYLKKLIKERSQYENQLNEGAEHLTAPISGMVSYKVDGYEEILTPDDFTKLNIELLENLELKTGQVVADSKESAKIINNFEAYIACILDSEQAKEAQVGTEVKLRLLNDVEVSSEVVYVKEENDKILLVFKVDKQVENLISYRKISFDIIWWSDSGKKIPNTSIEYEERGENKIAYVIRLRGDYEDKVWVKIKRQNDKYAIVENYTLAELQELGYTSEEINHRNTLSLYDQILKKPT